MVPMSKLVFTAKFNQAENIEAGFIEVPSDIEKALGSRGRVKVHSWIGGVYYRGSLVRMEKGGPLLLPVTKKVKAEAGIVFGDMIHVTLEEDKEIREVIVPDDLAAAFSNVPSVQAIFDSLSYTHRKEYVNWIHEAKKAETRIRRIEKCIEMLLSKKRHPADK
jgi:hypothetical protein